MKKNIFFLLFIFNVIIFANIHAKSYYKFNASSVAVPGVPAAANIIGVWRLVGHVYHGEVIPPFNDKLVLTFQFFEDGTDILKWYRIGENGFCERTATYQYDGRILSQQVVAVNPKNSFECGQDSDMRIGTKSISPFYKSGNKMYLELPLGDETLIYIWESMYFETPTPTPIPTVIPTTSSHN